MTAVTHRRYIRVFRRAAAFVIALALCAPTFFAVLDGSPARAEYNDSLATLSPVRLMVCIDSGEVLFQTGADDACPPAGFVCLAAAGVLLRDFPDADATVTVPENVSVCYNGDSPALQIRPGRVYYVRDLIAAFMMSTYVDALYTLSVADAGTTSAFVAKMNEWAAGVGCENTHFTNISGLDAEDQYTTARDVAKMAAALAGSDVFEGLASKTRIELAPVGDEENSILVTTGNKCIVSNDNAAYYSRSFIWGKSGRTSAAGCCAVEKSSRDGFNYITVVMKGSMIKSDKYNETINTAFNDCMTMVDWANKNLKVVTVRKASDIITELKVRNSVSSNRVSVVPEKDVMCIVHDQATKDAIEVREHLDVDSVDAPVAKGMPVGTAEVLYSGSVIATFTLVTGGEADYSTSAYVRMRIGRILSSWYMILLYILVAVFFVCYKLLGVRWSKKRRRPVIVEKYAVIDLRRVSDRISKR